MYLSAECIHIHKIVIDLLNLCNVGKYTSNELIREKI